MLKKWRILGLVFVLTIGGACERSSPAHNDMIRILDGISEADIRLTPLGTENELQPEIDRCFPIKSFLLTESGVRENPFNVKRKLKLGGTDLDILFSPPRSEYVWTADLNESSVLDFGIGIVQDANSVKPEGTRFERGGVHFSITLEANGRTRTVFQKYLPAPPIEEQRTSVLFRERLDLPYRLEGARLRFVTEGDAGNFSFWISPVLITPPPEPQAVILISLDTLRADHLGCYGYDRETSPNMDALTRDGVMFKNVYATSPWTLPSHVSMLTALDCVHHQVVLEDEKMNPTFPTLADCLRGKGFFCSAFTGGGFVSSIYGFSKGFDTYEEGAGSVFRRNSAEYLYLTTSQWLEERGAGNDFFLFLHTYQMHDPYVCPYPYCKMFLDDDAEWGDINLLGRLGGEQGVFRPLPDREHRNAVALYDAEIRYTDEKLIGPLIQKLKDLGLYERALIVVTSDHGEEFFEHGGWGHRHNVFDESLKVPLIIKFPRAQYAGRRIAPIVSLIDIMPTILEAVSVGLPVEDIDGRSLFPLLKGRESEDRTFMAELAGNVLNSRIPHQMSTNQGRRKLIVTERYRPGDLEHFLEPPPERPRLALYDLTSDPGESVNIMDQDFALANSLVQALQERRRLAPRRSRSEVQMDDQLKEQLRALGYIK